MTQGWKFRVAWKDGYETCIPFKDMKESNPVDVAELAKDKLNDDKPEFSWWVPYTLRKRYVIVSSIMLKVIKTTHKYGIEISTSVDHAYEINKNNKDTFWRDEICKELYNVWIDFDILDWNYHMPVGWNKFTGNMVFHIKMYFTRKALWVLDGHRTPDQEGSLYAGFFLGVLLL